MEQLTVSKRCGIITTEKETKYCETYTKQENTLSLKMIQPEQQRKNIIYNSSTL
jgi:hypothetical protein